MNMLQCNSIDMALGGNPPWFKAVMADLETPDCSLAIAALRSTLHALRDRIRSDDAAQLRAHLSFQLRDIYYENWQPAPGHRSSNDIDDFGDIARLLPRGSGLGAEAAVSATFGALAECIDPSDVAKVIEAMPEETVSLWPMNAFENRARLNF